MDSIVELPFHHLEDDNFHVALLELANGPIHFDPDRLSCLHFNPLDRRHNNLSHCLDLDPDEFFYPDSVKCEYYIEEEFNDMLAKNSTNYNSLSLLHFNIRSLSRNFNSLTDLLANINTKFSCIGISETWLKSSTHTCDIAGYNFVHNFRSSKLGGGVGLYVANEMEFKVRAYLDFVDKECAESLFVELFRTKEKNIIVGVIHRPPNQNQREFVNNIDQLIANISKENKSCYLMGDFNLNLLNHQSHDITGEFLDIMYSRMFVPLITRPTRITSHTATLIDNIFTNNIDDFTNCGLLVNDISDHLPIFSVLYATHIDTLNNNRWITYREKSPSNVAKFKDELSSVKWCEHPNYNDPLNAYRGFVNQFTAIYNNCFPIKKAKARRNNLKKPWITSGLLKSIKIFFLQYKRFLSNPTVEREQRYKSYKNKLNHALRVSKRNYYEKKLDDYKSNARGTWRILNEVINRQNKPTALPSTFKIGEVENNDPVEIANKFCEYFSNIGPSLADKIPISRKSHKSFLTKNSVNSIFIDTATQQEVVEISNSFRPGIAAGCDNIPMGIVKETIDVISEPLTHIINLSLTSGVVPDQLKIARLIPIFKTGDKGLLNNYRPVSILPIFSKLLERVMYKRLLNFLNKHRILSNNQFGFRKNHSTSLALIHLYDKISAAIDNREYTIGIFLDLSKAFDTVNHKILLDKLEHYGIRGMALEWFKSYLANRKQFVQYNGHCSLTQNIKCGVPQGSILGPLLFLLYINDLCEVSDALELILFADDTNVFFSHKNPEILMHNVNVELSKLTCWFH